LNPIDSFARHFFRLGIRGQTYPYAITKIRYANRRQAPTAVRLVYYKNISRTDLSVKILLNQEELDAGVERLAREINETYGKRPLTIVGVLTGSFILMADLIRKLKMPLRVGVVQTSSYEGTERGDLSINSEMMLDIAGRDVVLIDDIFDTGNTLAEVTQLMQSLGPNSLKSAVLLLKTGRQEVDWVPEFVAFDIPDEFVVGYGLDFNDEYRNLPFLACLEPEDLPDTAT
jgi:hypoxanthine phosphoribosyltransferase